MLQEIIGVTFDTVRVIKTSAGWVPERVPLIVDRRQLLDVVEALLKRVAVAPQSAAPAHQRSTSKQFDIRARVHQGEQKAEVAKAYGVSLETVNQLAVAR
jgi:DNA-binding NarL/FixJ family response regulator